MKKSKVHIITCALITLCITSLGCEPKLDQDLKDLCQMAKTASPQEDAETAQMTQIIERFSPRSKKGKHIKNAMADAMPYTAYDVARQAVAAYEADLLEGERWSCPTLEELQAQARCVSIEPTLDEIAYALMPLLRDEIPKIIAEALPEDRRAEAERIFNQELAVKLKLAEQEPDTTLIGTKDTIRKLAGCADTPAPEDACKSLQAEIPRLTSNRRIVIIGEAYGEALMQVGLNPSEYSQALQDRLITLAQTQLITALKPGIALLAEQTSCTFD